MKTTAEVLVTFLLNASWQIVVIAAAAALCDWLLRNTAARFRHAVWVIALVGSLFIPGLNLFGQFTRLTANSNQAPRKIASTPVVTTTIRSLDGVEIEPATSPRTTAAAIEPPSRNLLTPVRLSRNVAAVLLAIYGLFVLYAGLRFLRAWRRTRALVRSAFAFEMPQSIDAVVKSCERIIKARGTRFLCSQEVAVPITVGTLRPLIVLPASFLNETDEQVLKSAIGHELVHVARRDYLTNLIYEAIFLPLSFHPAAMLMRRRIRQTRELCCDEWVASRLLQPEVYARSLVRLIGKVPATHRLAADTTIGIAESGNLEVRIMSLLKMRRIGNRRKTFLLVTAFVLMAALCATAGAFALNFEIKKQEPQAPGQSKKKTELRDQERLRAELEQQVQELREREKEAPAAEREEVERHIRAVELALDEHQKLLQQYEQVQGESQPGAENRLKEVQENLEKHERLLQEYQLRQKVDVEAARASEQRLKELLKQYPENASAARELQELYESQQKWKTLAEGEQQNTRNARVIYRVEPTYPDDAREKQITGSVVLSLTVDHSGLPQNITVKRSLYPSMDQAAIEAAQKMRFEPAMKDGQIVSQVLQVEFYFSMETKRVSAGVGYGSGEGTGSGSGSGFRKSEGGAGYAIGQNSKVYETRIPKEQYLPVPEDRGRRQAELAQAANISMDRAIQIATSKYPGKVIACSLGRDQEGPVFYHLVIVYVDGDKRTVKYVWINAMDGAIMKTEEDASKSAAPISGGGLNGKAITIPRPKYPDVARAAKAEGEVTVQVTINEQGDVIYARAVSGHPLLQGAAVAAAREAKFSPTYLEGQPVKVTGALTYTFTVQ